MAGFSLFTQAVPQFQLILPYEKMASPATAAPG